MKERILKGWNIQRGIYLLMGGIITYQSAINSEWVGVILGSYFASMAIFRIGCAGGNCYGGNCAVDDEETLVKSAKPVYIDEKLN